MRSAIVTSFLLLTAACAGPSDPALQEDELALSALVSNVPQVFVLSAADGVAAEPVVLFDHTCQGVRYVHTIRDSIVLNPDGTALRSWRLDRSADQQPLDSSSMTARGTWTRLANARTYYYFNKAPSIELTLKTDNSKITTSYSMPMRLDGSSALSNLAGMGGSCPGSPNDGREAEFKYTRR